MRAALSLKKIVSRVVLHGGAHRVSTMSDLGLTALKYASVAQSELRDGRWVSWPWAFLGFGSATLLYAGANIVECEAMPRDKVKVRSCFPTTFENVTAQCVKIPNALVSHGFL